MSDFSGKREEFFNVEITNDDFYPFLSLRELQLNFRIPTEYQRDMIINELYRAIIEVNRALNSKKKTLIEDGHSSLTEAMPEMVGNNNVSELRYKYAVYALTKYFLLKQFSTMNRRVEAENSAIESMETAEYWKHESTKSIDLIISEENKTYSLDVGIL